MMRTGCVAWGRGANSDEIMAQGANHFIFQNASGWGLTQISYSDGKVMTFGHCI